LKAPPNVYPRVIVLCEAAGGKDIEFAVPGSIREQFKINVVPQMDDTDCRDVAKPLGNMQSGEISTEFAEASIGEKIINFRTLLKRFTGIATDVNTVASADAWNVRPWCVQWYDSDAVEDPNQGNRETPDLYSHLGAIFCLSRGGARIKYMNNNGGSTRSYAKMSYFEKLATNATNEPLNKVWSGIQVGVYRDRTNQNNTTIANVAQEFGAEFEVPQYSYFHSRSNAELRVGGRYLFPQSFSDPASTLPSVILFDVATGAYSAPSNDTNKPFFLRAGGEDTNFGLFVSIPPSVEVPLVL